MTNQEKQAIRTAMCERIMAHLNSEQEDCAFCGNSTLNLPFVGPNGEEGFVEIKVSIPVEKDGDDGFAKRQSHAIAVREKAEKAKAAAEKKAKKIAADNARRAAKAAEKSVKA